MVLPGEALRTHAPDGLAHIFASLELPPPPGMHCLAAQLQAWLTASRDKTNESSRMAPETTLDPNLVDPGACKCSPRRPFHFPTGLIGLSSTPRACKCSPRRPFHFPTGLIGLSSTVSRLLKAFFVRYNALLKGTL
jgi:hypothetical protein